MKLLIDENLPIVIVELARKQEIEASSVRDELPGAPKIRSLDPSRFSDSTGDSRPSGMLTSERMQTVDEALRAVLGL